MKNILMLFALVTLVFNMYAQTPTNATKDVIMTDPVVNTQTANQLTGDLPVMTFESETIDYGTIAHNADPFREFHFTNTGKAPLIINNCAGTCGCTIPDCPKEAIQPGEKGNVKVRYATDRIGQFNKGVKIYSNASAADAPIMLYIKGNVLPDETPTQTGPTQEMKDQAQPH